MAVDIGKVGGRAATGAAIGSVVPGVGTAIGGAAGAVEGLLEGLFSGDGGQGAVDAAGREKLARMQQAYGVLMAEREKRKQMQLNMLGNRMGAYQGANNVLASMYGPMGSMAPNLNIQSGGPRMAGQPPPLPPQYKPPSAQTAPPASYGGGAPQPPGNTSFVRKPTLGVFAPPTPGVAPPAALPQVPGATNFGFAPKPVPPAIAAPSVASAGAPPPSLNALQALGRLFAPPGASAPNLSASGGTGGVGGFSR